jgi:acetyl-CoA C-acetyltransferase
LHNVAVVGCGTVPWQPNRADKTFRSLALEAAKAALSDAGLSHQDVDLVVYSLCSEVQLRQQIPTLMLQEYLGFQSGASLRVEAGDATDGYSIGMAASHIRAARGEVILVLGIQKALNFYDFETKSHRDGYVHGTSNTTDATWLQPVMTCSEAFLNAFVVNPWMQRHPGITPEHLARVVVKNYEHARHNPEAMRRNGIAADEVLASPMIASPTTSLMCADYVDGACAMVLVSEDQARELTKTPIWIPASTTSSHALHRAAAEDMGRLTGTYKAARKAYELASITDPANQFDLAQVHDLISALELIACEELGLARPGRSGERLDNGDFSIGGALPVNVEGGRIACGHSSGVSGLYAACEIVRQLREEAQDRQVALRYGRGVLQCVDSHGGMSSVTIFERT